MVARFAAFVTLVAATAAGATVLPRGGGAPDCNTGPIQCCNQLEKSGGLIGGLTAFIGLGCSPINIIGLSASSCSASPVCCQNNNVGGLISIGCVPVEL